MTTVTPIDVEDRTQGALLTEQPPRSPSWLGAVRRRLRDLAAHQQVEVQHLWHLMGEGLGVLVRVAEEVPNLQQPVLEIEGASLVISWVRGDESRAMRVTAGPRVSLTVDGVPLQHAPTDLTAVVRVLRSSADARLQSEPELHRELSAFVRTLQTPSRPQASDDLRALARKAVAARNAEPSMSEDDWAEGLANLVIDGFDE